MNFFAYGPDDWVNLATITGGFAIAIAAAFAIVGIPLALFQVKSTRAIQREATAKSLYREYLADAVEKPDFTAPDFDKIVAEGRLKIYELYVAHMMFALEEVLANLAHEEWRQVVKAQLKRRQIYLESDHFQNHKRGLYGRDLVELIDDVTRQRKTS